LQSQSQTSTTLNTPPSCAPIADRSSPKSPEHDNLFALDSMMKKLSTPTRGDSVAASTDPPDSHAIVPDDIQEGLATLVLWWYGNHRAIREVLRDGFSSSFSSPPPQKQSYYSELPPHCLEDAWRMRWFVKGELTEVVDRTMKQQFAWLLEDDIVQAQLVSSASDSTKNCLWYRMALILLFDQVTRNIYRGTSLAYSGDAIARPLALELAESFFFETLPFHFQATVCICLCHAEDARIQSILRECLEKIISKQNNNDRCLVAALQEIQKKHEERIVLFGRFPERNVALGRTNSVEEEAYLAQL